MSLRDLAAALLVILIWGLNFVVIKLGLAAFTPLQLGAGRFAIAAIPLLLWVARPQIPVRVLFTYAMLQGFGQFLLLFLSLSVGMSAALGSVIAQVQPFLTAIFARVLLGESLGRTLRIGFVLAALGLACFMVQAALVTDATEVTVAGIVLSVGAAACWAGSNIVVRRIAAAGWPCDSLALVVWSSAITAPCFALLSLVVDEPARQAVWLEASAENWAALLYLGWGSTLVAYGLWTLLLKRHAASRVGPFSMGVPAIGVLAGVLVLGEQVSPLQWVGTGLVVAALMVVFATRSR